jgi:GTP-binding protein
LKFVDEAKIHVRSGHGGAGCVSFRREKYIPKGGPDGGDGGRGGDVIVKALSQKDTLLKFHYNQHFAAKNGLPGKGRNQTGEDGEDLIINVPPGTLVKDAVTGELIRDLPSPGDSFVLCKGGRGGQGNARFKSATMRTPRFAQPGEDYEEKYVLLELRLLADAALVGYPNVGKSTLISKLSSAKPKIANYEFTTLIPNLGVVSVGEDRSYVLADLPGLVDGASEGLGLGLRFLKHINRTSVIVHILDPSRLDLENPTKDLENILKELKNYDPSLLKKPKLIAMGKMDLPEGEEALKAFKKAKPRTPVYPFSSFTGLGLNELRYAVWRMILEAKEKAEEEKAALIRAELVKAEKESAKEPHKEPTKGSPKEPHSEEKAKRSEDRGKPDKPFDFEALDAEDLIELEKDLPNKKSPKKQSPSIKKETGSGRIPEKASEEKSPHRGKSSPRGKGAKGGKKGSNGKGSRG